MLVETIEFLLINARKHWTHTYKGNKMTTATPTAYYRVLHNKISNSASAFVKWFIDISETVGTARAASQLAQQGHHELAKELLLNSGGKKNV